MRLKVIFTQSNSTALSYIYCNFKEEMLPIKRK